jgi:glycosyltransferase involved in cell wall biosynthesis
MRISVITICHNSAATIERTIKSVINQTAFANVEYIIIDGASSDGTQEIVKKYQDKISVFVSEKDAGIYNAMNKGIKRTSGNYIHFLNSNDFYENDAVIAKFVDAAEKSGSDFLVGDVILVTADGQEIHRSNQEISALTLFTSFFYHVCLFAKRELFEKFGLFDENYKIAADNAWIIPLMLNQNISKSYVKIPVAKFGLDGVSNKEESRDKTIAELEEILCKNYRGTNNVLRKILQDKVFNQVSSFPFKILHKLVKKVGLKKFLKKLVLTKSNWQIKYHNS